MGQVKYYYNSKTCRYEPVGLSFWKVATYLLLFIITTTLLSSGMLVLHSRLFETDKSRALRKENGALKEFHSTVESKLNTIESSLLNLNQQEASLGNKLFGKSTKEEISPSTDVADKERILLADASVFGDIVTMLKEKSQSLVSHSTQMSGHFGNITVSAKDIKFLMTVPSIVPIQNDLSKLVSGYGTRINPFHKGNYLHPGADFAAAHGSPILATGNGRVISAVRNSSVQAGYGNYIEIDHGNGLVTRYSHLEEVKVKAGQKIIKGSVIGTVGMSGGTIAPHVHYEILRKGEPVNPLPYMMEGLTGKQYDELQRLGNKRNQSLD